MTINNIKLLGLIISLTLTTSGCVAQAKKELLKNHTAMVTHNYLEVNIISLNGKRYPSETKGHLGKHTEVQPGLQKIMAQLTWTNDPNIFGPYYRITSPVIKQACFIAEEGNVLQVGAELHYNQLNQQIPNWDVRVARLDVSAKKILYKENFVPLVSCPQ